MLEWLIAEVFAKYNYWVSIVLMLIGFYAMIAKDNLMKKIIGLNIFQTAIILFFISLGDVSIGGWGGGVTEPIVKGALPWETGEGGAVYANPLPHVLMLTAIVVGAATTAVALALVIRLHEEYGTIEESEIIEKERERELP
ncbi:MAG: Na+/H+ antiporter subunit C [Candidatus Methanophagaceae archaeon]|nr:MAG: Na+/H+ antiporter subunit C [Methanophagales archaeon]